MSALSHPWPGESDEARTEFHAPRRAHLTSAAGLAGLLGGLAWILVAKPDPVRGIDPASPSGRNLLLLLALAPLCAAIEFVWRAARRVADATIDSKGISVRRLFRSTRIPWPEVASISAGPRSYGLHKIRLISIHRTGHGSVDIVSRFEDATEEQVLEALAAGWMRSSERRDS
jgi:hypothetical protein